MTDHTPQDNAPQQGDQESTPLQRAAARAGEVSQRVRSMDPLRRKVLLGSLAFGALVLSGLALYLGVYVHPGTVLLFVVVLVLPRLLLDRLMCRLIERHQTQAQSAQKVGGVLSRIRSLFR